MNALTVDRISTEIRARISGQSENDALMILRDLVSELARDSADQTFWKVRHEEFTLDQTDDLSDTIAKESTLAIAEALHRLGGGLNTALDLSERWVGAYKERLKALRTAPSKGGCA